MGLGIKVQGVGFRVLGFMLRRLGLEEGVQRSGFSV